MTYIPSPGKVKSATKQAVTVVQVAILIKDERHCGADSWVDGNIQSGRCSGISAILDSSDLRCKHFGGELRTLNDNGTIVKARWGQERPILRCSACILGESLLLTNGYR